MRILLALLLALALALAACNGDDDDGTEPSRTATETPAEETEDPGDDGKTPGPDETPDGDGETPTNTGPGPTPADEGIRAVAPADQDEFIAQFSGQILDRETCQFNPSSFLTDCGDNGIYAVDPPLTGQDVSCDVALNGGNPVFVTCTSQEPLTTIFYEIIEE